MVKFLSNLKALYVVLLWSVTDATTITVYNGDSPLPLENYVTVSCQTLKCVCTAPPQSSSIYCSWVDNDQSVLAQHLLSGGGVTVPYTPIQNSKYVCMYTYFDGQPYGNGDGDQVEVTCSHTQSTSSPTSTSTNAPSSTDAPSTNIGNESHFRGLNPLIYTSTSALFIVTLTVVAIVTCWIRSRKNTRLRTLLPQNSPQDYLDYIQEGQFTPLTTSEFIASLRERPPTYNESEVLERSQQDEEPRSPPQVPTPPPLPPRNTRGSDQSTTEVTETSAEEDSSPPTDRNDGSSSPLLMDLSDSIANLPLLTPIPAHNIVGVVPSLDAVV